MSNIIAIFKKQIKDTLKNKTILIQFVMFPILSVIMQHSIQIAGMPENFFVNLFSTMYIGMAPLVSMSAILSEERENHTLDVLFMSHVKPHEYLLGIGGCIWLTCMLGTCVFCISAGYSSREAAAFFIVMAAGILTSLLIGAAIGAWSKSQMQATSVTVPLMMIFSFLPMLSVFNKTASKAAGFLYSEQIRLIVTSMPDLHVTSANIGVISANILLALLLFVTAYKKCGLT